VGLASLLMDRYKRKVKRFILVPTDQGRFEVSVGADLVWSKEKSGEFPDDLALAKVIDGKLGIR